MVLQFINKKDFWTADDLIIYFGLYVNPAKDYKNPIIGDFFALDKPMDSEVFFATESQQEWLELCKRFVFKNDSSSIKTKENIKSIVEKIAKAQGGNVDIFLEAIDKNSFSYGEYKKVAEKADFYSENNKESDKTEQEAKKKIDEMLAREKDKVEMDLTDETTMAVLNVALNQAEATKKDNVPFDPKPTKPHQD